jgi:hypothetical protein
MDELAAAGVTAWRVGAVEAAEAGEPGVELR